MAAIRLATPVAVCVPVDKVVGATRNAGGSGERTAPLRRRPGEVEYQASYDLSKVCVQGWRVKLGEKKRDIRHYLSCALDV